MRVSPDRDIAYHSEYAPDIYEVVLRGARIGSVQRYGRGEWVPYMAPGFHTALREYPTRWEAGRAMARAWDRAHA